MNPRAKETNNLIDERQVERDLEAIHRLASLPRQRNLQDVEALIERLRVDSIVRDYKGSRKQFQRALIDLYEDILEERYDKEKEDRSKTRKSVLAYVRGILDGLDP